MGRKMAYTSDRLVHKTFSKNVKGYDPLEVDTTLDEVVDDYRAYEKYYQEAQAYIRDLETKVTELKDKISDLETKNAILNNRLSGIKDDANVSKGNIVLLQRISKLESALYLKGVDPSKIK